MTDIRVVIADDHPVVRSGIREMLTSHGDIQVVGEASTGEEALNLVGTNTPDILLLDMELPGISGVEVARQLQQEGSPVKILALSTYDDKEYISELLAVGAYGYLLKEEVPNQIISAVQGVARGQRGWLSRQVASKMMDTINKGDQETEKLSSRECQVLSLVVRGMTNAEIAYRLSISEKTVEKHMNSIFTRLNVNSRVEAAVLAVRKGLVEP